MGGKSSGAPDPRETAQAQSEFDKKTAAFNAVLSRTNTTTPYGNQTWAQHGTDPTTGAPIYSQNISLNPTSQSTLDSNQNNALNLSGVQGRLLGNAGNNLSQPVDMSGLQPLQSSVNGGDLAGLAGHARQASYDSSMALLNPQFQQQHDQLQTQLANQGIAAGSEAANNATGNQNRQQDWTRTQAANQATLTGQGYENQLYNQGMGNAQLNNATQGQQLSQRMSLHDQPLNEYNSLLSGTQVQNPQFGAQQQVQPIQSPNYSQLVQNQANAQAGSGNSFMSGLFGLGGAALGGPMGGAAGSFIGNMFK